MIKNKVEPFLRLYIHHRNLYMKGTVEVSFVKSILAFQPLMIMWLFVKSLWAEIPNSVVYVAVPTFVVMKCVGCWGLGWWWEKNRVFDKESDWVNKRNPVMDGLDKKVLGKEEVRKDE